MPIANGFDYFESFNRVSGWYYSPLICIIDPEPALKYYSIHAVKLWDRQLERMNITGYDYRIAVYDEIKDKCDATISFGNANDVWTRFNSEVAGTTCFESSTIHDKKQNVIRDGTRSCFSIINIDYYQGRFVHSAIVHETGHILGIGHRLPLEIASFPYVVLTKDIMNTHLQVGPVLTPESIEALQHFYNYNGWNGAGRINYTVPHD